MRQNTGGPMSPAAGASRPAADHRRAGLSAGSAACPDLGRYFGTYAVGSLPAIDLTQPFSNEVALS